MKFGKQIKRLADPADLNHYLAYDVLKKAIHVAAPQEVGVLFGGERDARTARSRRNPGRKGPC